LAVALARIRAIRREIFGGKFGGNSIFQIWIFPCYSKACLPNVDFIPSANHLTSPVRSWSQNAGKQRVTGISAAIPIQAGLLTITGKWG
jgi:hypothetical protein